MINIDLFRHVLEDKKDPGFIEHNENITDDLLQLFLDTPAKISKIQSLFKKVKLNPSTNRREKHSHKVKIICLKCKKFIEYRNLSLSQFINYLCFLRKEKKYYWNENDFVCKDCACKEKRKVEEERYNNDKKYQLFIENNTKIYIEEILNPNVSYKKGTSNIAKRREVFNYYIDKNIIQEYIQNMSYKDFLQTIYWSVIASHVKYKSDYKCQLCDSKFLLNVHHKTYDRHGLEHLYWRDDLICLCQDCHSKFHNK